MPEDKKDEGPAHLDTFIPGKLIKNPMSMVGLLVVVGIGLERRRRVRGLSDALRFPKIDLNNPKQRSSVAFVLSFLVIFALLSAVGSFKA